MGVAHRTRADIGAALPPRPGACPGRGSRIVERRHVLRITTRRCTLPRSPPREIGGPRSQSVDFTCTWLALQPLALPLECEPLAASRVMKDLNPYVEARREWNDRYLDLVRARRWWQVAAVS